MTAGERLKAWARRIKRDGVTLWFACKSPMTPWYAKALGAFVVAYALSPIDLIPDFIPVLGYVDDVLLLPALIWLTVRLLPPAVLADIRQKADACMQAEGRKPRSRAGVAPADGRLLAHAGNGPSGPCSFSMTNVLRSSLEVANFKMPP